MIHTTQNGQPVVNGETDVTAEFDGIRQLVILAEIMMLRRIVSEFLQKRMVVVVG